MDLSPAVLCPLLVLLPLLSTVSTVTATDDTDDWRLCGQMLSDTLALICRGRGFNMGVYTQKRSGDISYHHNHILRKRTIVDECCHDVCSFAKLESYCAPGPSMMTGQLTPTNKSKFFRRPGIVSPDLSDLISDLPANRPTPPPSSIQVGKLEDIPNKWFWVTPAVRDPLAKFLIKRTSSKPDIEVEDEKRRK